MKKAMPIVLGYLPVAFTFGVLASKAGLSPLEAGLMSLMVFAGSGQLIAVDLMLAGMSTLTVVITTFVVNARHLLMSAALTPFLGRWSKKKQLLYTAEMTDETFAMNISSFVNNGVNRDEAFGVNVMSHAAWIFGGVCGAAFGNLIGDLRPYGLDFALAGMFIALLTPHFTIPRNLVTALMGGALSIALCLKGFDQWNIIIATGIAATLGMFLPFGDQKDKARKSEPDADGA